MKSITILIPYFGAWPFWFDFFLTSCRYNPTINWLIFTDCAIPSNSPKNVQFQQISFSEYKHRVGDTLRIDFNPVSPYKLCDIKPAYGFIHQADIENADFWGFGDIDVVYGDLRSYFTEEILSHQLISCHGRRVSGHLTLIENSELMRNAFRQIPDWKNLMSGPHVALDEKKFSHIFLRHRSWPNWFRKIFYRNNPYMQRVYFNETYSTCNAGVCWLDGSFNFPQLWFFQAGKLTNNLTGNREFPYLHFLQWKRTTWNKSDQSQLIWVPPDEARHAYCISENGFSSI